MENQKPNEELQDSSQGAKAPNESKKSKAGWVIIFGIVLIVLVVVILDRVVGVNIFTSDQQRQEEEVTEFLDETGAWHAVFLTNGQVYFGQLKNPEAQYAGLSDVYYLQLQQTQAAPAAKPGQTAPPVDPNDPEGSSQVISAPQPEPPRLTLIKFGTELHGPKDFMNLNRDHILFWEELEADSQVVKAIADYKKNQE